MNSPRKQLLRSAAFATAFAVGLSLSTAEEASARQPIGECEGPISFRQVMLASRLLNSGCDVVYFCWLADADNEEYPYGVGCKAAE